MRTSPVQRRWLAVGATAAILGGVLAVVALQAPRAADESGRSAGKNVPGRKPGEWPLFGGSVSRNLVNLVDTNIPTDWDVAKGAAGNIKWSQNLGSKAYGGPIISGGKIFIGTNNGQPRDPSVKGDKGVVMCFDQQTGKFLWQSVFDKLKAGRVSDWPEEGICSSPVVQGDRLWYICNRAEVICSSTDNGKIVWRLDMIGKLNVFPHNLTTCSPLVVGDTLFVITSNGVDEGHINIPQPESPSFLAINKNTGAVLWSSNLPSVNLIELRKKDPTLGIQTMKDKGQILMHGQWSNPVYAEPNGKPMIIFPGGDGWMYGFNPSNGELLWKFDCNPKSAFYMLGPKARATIFWRRRSSGRTSCTSASARTPSTRRAWAISGASTSARNRRTRTRTCRPSPIPRRTRSSTRRTPGTRTPASSGTMAASTRPRSRGRGSSAGR